MTKNRFSKFRAFCTGAVIATGIGLAGCYPDMQELRVETAQRLAGPMQMLHRTIEAGPFLLTAYERVYDQGQPATIYIEGDGIAWVSKTRPSLNPTPRNPVALHLASHDDSPNVIYLARPCQYSGTISGNYCDEKYWTDERYSPEVINAMNEALDNIKSKYDIPAFNLVGFSGGAAVATLVAAKRDDIASIRTVAGNLNPDLVNEMHKVSPMPGSLNPVAIAAKIANIPQHHFIGEWDEVVPPAVYDSFRAAAGQTTCMRSSIVKKVNHEEGWVNVWPTLMDAPLDCNKMPGPVPGTCPAKTCAD